MQNFTHRYRPCLLAIILLATATTHADNRIVLGNYSELEKAEADRHLLTIKKVMPDAWLDRQVALAESRRESIVLGSFANEQTAWKYRDDLQQDFGAVLEVGTANQDAQIRYRVMTPATSHSASVESTLKEVRKIYPGAWIHRSTGPENNKPLKLTIQPKDHLGINSSGQTTAQGSTKNQPQAPREKLSPSAIALPAEPSRLAELPEPPEQVIPRTVVMDSKKPPRARVQSDWVPPGFEDLLEPQTTQIDVYFGSRLLTSTLATYTPTEITLLTPGDILPHMSDVLEPENILKMLSGSLPTNSALVCLNANQSGCGELETESLEVIFDESRFRLDLFLNKSLLAVRDVNIDKFLPRSSGGLALLNQIYAAANGSEGRSSDYNVGNSTTISYRETRLLAISNMTQEDDFTVDTLALEREVAGRRYQAGYFRAGAANLRFLTEKEFAGITISSTLDTRNDLDQSSGNNLQVFLANQSRVDLLKDNRLISTGVYDAGNQIINTSALPGGAYDIVLRIRDSFGRTREETRFYAKTNLLPPADQALYFFDVGEIAVREDSSTLPQTNGESIVRAGFSKRLSKGFGGQLGVLSQEDEQLFEAGLFRLGRSYEIDLNLAAGNDRDRGVSLNARIRKGLLTFNADFRKTWVDEERDGVSLLNRKTTQGSLNVTMPLWRGTLSLTGRYNERGNGDADKNVGFRYEFPDYVVGRSVLETDIQATRDNDDSQVLFTMRLRLDSGNWRNEMSSQYYFDDPENSDSEDGFVNNLSTSWSDGDRYLSDVSWNLRAVKEREDETMETNFEVASDYGRMNADVIYSRELDAASWGASLHTNIIANRDTFSFGGREQARSALVMDVKGDIGDSYFDVLVNGSPRGNARIGARTVIGIQPYETYSVTLLPRGDSLVDFNNQVQTATLYPGNVVTMDWKATRVLVAFGQLVTPDGDAVDNALISGVTGIATTDEYGYFQAEIEPDTRQIKARQRTSECTATLPEFDSLETVVLFEDIECY